MTALSLRVVRPDDSLLPVPSRGDAASEPTRVPADLRFFVPILRRAKDGLGAREYKLFTAIYDLCQVAGARTIEATNLTLGRESGMGERTLFRVLTVLETGGWIARNSEHGRRQITLLDGTSACQKCHADMTDLSGRHDKIVMSPPLSEKVRREEERSEATREARETPAPPARSCPPDGNAKAELKTAPSESEPEPEPEPPPPLQAAPPAPPPAPAPTPPPLPGPTVSHDMLDTSQLPLRRARDLRRRLLDDHAWTMKLAHDEATVRFGRPADADAYPPPPPELLDELRALKPQVVEMLRQDDRRPGSGQGQSRAAPDPTPREPPCAAVVALQAARAHPGDDALVIAAAQAIVAHWDDDPDFTGTHVKAIRKLGAAKVLSIFHRAERQTEPWKRPRYFTRACADEMNRRPPS